MNNVQWTPQRTSVLLGVTLAFVLGLGFGFVIGDKNRVKDTVDAIQYGGVWYEGRKSWACKRTDKVGVRADTRSRDGNGASETEGEPAP